MKPAGVPHDIYRALKRWCATQRAILTTRDQVRRRVYHAHHRLAYTVPPLILTH
jgi:hypothetical protein